MPDALYCRNCGQKRAEQAVYIQSEPAAQIGSWQRYGSASLGNYAGAPAAQAASESARDVQRYVTGGSVAHVGSSGPQLPAYTVDAALAQTSPTAVAGTYTTGGSAGSYTPRTAQMHSGSYSPYSNAGAAQLPATHYVAGGYAGSYANGSAVQGAPVGLYTGNAAHLPTRAYSIEYGNAGVTQTPTAMHAAGGPSSCAASGFVQATPLTPRGVAAGVIRNYGSSGIQGLSTPSAPAVTAGQGATEPAYGVLQRSTPAVQGWANSNAIPQTPLVPTAPPQPPGNLTEGLPDPQAIDSQKSAYHRSLAEQAQQGEDMLKMQQKQQTEHMYQAAEAQKQQLICQIEQQAKQKELEISQAYTNQVLALQQELQHQKMVLERQAHDLAMEWQRRKSQEDMLQQQYELQRAHYEDQVKMIRGLEKVRDEHSKQASAAATPQHTPRQVQAEPSTIPHQSTGSYLPAPTSHSAPYVAAPSSASMTAGLQQSVNYGNPGSLTPPQPSNLSMTAGLQQSVNYGNPGSLTPPQPSNLSMHVANGVSNYSAATTHYSAAPTRYSAAPTITSTYIGAGAV